MFGVDWSNPFTLGVNIANLVLGLVSLAAIGVLAYAVAFELAAHWKARHARHHVPDFKTR